MAIFGTLSTLADQAGGSHSRFEDAFRYLTDAFVPGSAANNRLQHLGEGETHRVELAGGAFALEQVYRTKPRSEAIFESHRAFIDIQVIVSGEEIIGVNDIRGLTLKEDRTPGSDVLLYHVPATCTELRLAAGDAAILYPVDGHMPQVAPGQPGLIRKIVVKVPVG
jgi:YhcH/YjgK/YiaL family protein